MALLNSNKATATVAAAAETAIVVSPIDSSTNESGNGCIVFGTISSGTASAAGTAAIVTIRQGSGTSGTIVGTFTQTQAVGSTACVSFCAYDAAPLVSQQYTATLTYTANATSLTVTGTINVLNIAGVLD